MVIVDLWSQLQAERSQGEPLTYAHRLVDHPLHPERYTQTVAGVAGVRQAGEAMEAVRDFPV